MPKDPASTERRLMFRMAVLLPCWARASRRIVKALVAALSRGPYGNPLGAVK